MGSALTLCQPRKYIVALSREGRAARDCIVIGFKGSNDPVMIIDRLTLSVFLAARAAVSINFRRFGLARRYLQARARPNEERIGGVPWA